MAAVPRDSPRAAKPRNAGVSLLSGASAGLLSAVLFQPLDLVKTRLQVAASGTAASSANSPPLSMTGTLRTIAAVEGPLALWTGLGASVIRLSSGIGLYFGTLSLLESQVSSVFPGASNPWKTFAVGASARTLSGLMLLPVTVVKARLESGLYRGYGGVFSGLRSVARNEGARGLFAGLSVTILRDAPSSGAFYVLFRQLQAVTGANAPETSATRKLALNASSGLVAGAASALLTQPLDVVKTQMQTRSDGSSMRSSLMAIVRQQGLSGLMSGFLPRAWRRTLMAAVSWTVYEHLTPLYVDALASRVGVT